MPVKLVVMESRIFSEMMPISGNNSKFLRDDANFWQQRGQSSRCCQSLALSRNFSRMMPVAGSISKFFRLQGGPLTRQLAGGSR